MRPLSIPNTVRYVLVTAFFFIAPTVMVAEKMTVTYYYVGAGNCTVIECPGSDDKLLIDCGSHRVAERGPVADDIGQKLSGPGAVNLILTHPDQDHYNFLIYLPDLFDNLNHVYAGGNFNSYSQGNNEQGSTNYRLRAFAAGNIYGQGSSFSNTPGVAIEAKDYFGQTYKQVDRLTFSPTDTPTDLQLCGDAQVFLLAANSASGAWNLTNPQSLIVAVRYAGVDFIFPGDSDFSGGGFGLQNALVSWANLNGVNLNGDFATFREELHVEFMMASHHGSDENQANWNGWANVTSPSYLVFSGKPDSTSPTLRHPTEGGYEPYLGNLRGTTAPLDLHVKDPGGSSNAARLTITEAALGLFDVYDLEVVVSDNGVFELKCHADATDCDREFFNRAD